MEKRVQSLHLMTTKGKPLNQRNVVGFFFLFLLETCFKCHQMLSSPPRPARLSWPVRGRRGQVLTEVVAQARGSSSRARCPPGVQGVEVGPWSIRSLVGMWPVRGSWVRRERGFRVDLALGPSLAWGDVRQRTSPGPAIRLPHLHGEGVGRCSGGSGRAWLRAPV